MTKLVMYKTCIPVMYQLRVCTNVASLVWQRQHSDQFTSASEAIASTHLWRVSRFFSFVCRILKNWSIKKT